LEWSRFALGEIDMLLEAELCVLHLDFAGAGGF
jgi:hypothetical protein